MKNKIDYLRVSLTDRCNLRCCYCIPQDGMQYNDPTKILSLAQIVAIVKAFVSLGGKKVRLTGGEPLLREGIVDLIKDLRDIRGLDEVCLTTNGILLKDHVNDLKSAGLSRINISLDTLRPDKFKLMTRQDKFYQVLTGIRKAKEAGFDPIKLNVVVMKGINDNEIIDFIKLSIEEGLVLRFIEFMKVTPLWEEALFIPIEEIIKICEGNFIMKRVGYIGASPCEYYSILNNLIGFIRTAELNCNRCSRLRLTSDGKLKVCLYEGKSDDIKGFLSKDDGSEGLKRFILSKMKEKDGVNYMRFNQPRIYMSSIGG